MKQHIDVRKKISDFFSRSLEKSAEDIVVTFFKVIFSLIALLLLNRLVINPLQEISIPIIFLIILCLFALVGVFVPLEKIFNSIKQQNTLHNKKRVYIIEDEHSCKFVAYCYISNLDWKVFNGYFDVYCEKHDLKLELSHSKIQSSVYITSKCRECAHEQNNYYKIVEIPDGVAIHCESDDKTQFENEVIARLERAARRAQNLLK